MKSDDRWNAISKILALSSNASALYKSLKDRGKLDCLEDEQELDMLDESMEELFETTNEILVKMGKRHQPGWYKENVE